MPSDQQPDQIERLKEMVHEMHGHRIAVTQQHVREGEMKEAAEARAQAIAFWKVIELLNHERDGTTHGYRGPTEYAELSKVWFDVERAASESNDREEPDIRGMQ